jgi:hypothetical protein
MMYSSLKTGRSTGAIPTCRPSRGAKLDGNKAMLFSFGVTFPADAVTRSLEMG